MHGARPNLCEHSSQSGHSTASASHPNFASEAKSTLRRGIISRINVARGGRRPCRGRRRTCVPHDPSAGEQENGPTRILQDHACRRNRRRGRVGNRSSNRHRRSSAGILPRTARKLPVRKFDVVVAGGGTAGVVAAIAAARQGAKTASDRGQGLSGRNGHRRRHGPAQLLQPLEGVSRLSRSGRSCAGFPRRSSIGC